MTSAGRSSYERLTRNLPNSRVSPHRLVCMCPPPAVGNTHSSCGSLERVSGTVRNSRSSLVLCGSDTVDRPYPAPPLTNPRARDPGSDHSLAIEHEARYPHPEVCQGATVEDLIDLEDPRAVPLIVQRRLRGIGGNPRLIGPRVKRGVVIHVDKRAPMGAGMVIGKGVEQAIRLQVDVEHAAAVQRVVPFGPGLDHARPPQFPGIDRIPVAVAAPGGRGRANRPRG